MLSSSLRKFFSFYRIYFADAVAYRANAAIWLLTDTFPAIIMPLIWLASYGARDTIGGFTRSQMVVYYLMILFLSCIVESHIMWDISTMVKDGGINMYLTRPFSYSASMYAQNISWRFMRALVFIPLFLGMLALFHRWVHWSGADYNYGWQFWLAVIGGHLVSYFIAYCMGMLAFYLLEVQSIYYFYYLPLVLFNGQLAPLAFFPRWLAEIATYLPFYYTMAFPAQIFLKHTTGDALWTGYAVQAGWLILFVWLSGALYKGGMKRFTAYGI